MPKKILIVEDEQSLLKAMVMKLGKAGYSIRQAKDGVEGLKVALDEKPDLILLDILMPMKNGLEMLAELRKDKWGKTAKVIVLSNYSDHTAEKALNEGVEKYLIKVDWKIEDIISTVKKSLSQ